MTTEHFCQRLFTLRDNDGTAIREYRCGELIGPQKMYCEQCEQEMQQEKLSRSYCEGCDE